jgi:hypothetical protein
MWLFVITKVANPNTSQQAPPTRLLYALPETHQVLVVW